MTNNIVPLLSEHYLERLSTDYPANHIEAISAGLKSASLPHRPGESITYARINEGASTPTLYINGFTEGITSKAPFALELTKNVDRPSSVTQIQTPEGTRSITSPAISYPGLDVIFVDQHRGGIDTHGVNRRGKPTKDATYSQALNYLAVLEAETGNEPINIITHSYGSLVLQSMVEIAEERQLSVLKDAHAVLLAPAGLYVGESLPRLGSRFVTSMASEMRSSKDFPDEKNEMMKAVTRSMLANPRRSWREVNDMTSRKVDLRYLLSNGIATIAVMGFGEDKLFSSKQLDKSLSGMPQFDVSYLTPISTDTLDKRGNLRLADGATHNDDTFNPSRVADSVKQYLSVTPKLLF